jgi:hypothetical protein
MYFNTSKLINKNIPMFSAIKSIRKIGSQTYVTPLFKRITSESPAKLAFIGSGLTLSSLGFYRGCNEYYIAEIKNGKSEFNFANVFCCSMFGIIGASTYINPVFAGFAIRHEYLNAKSWFSGTADPTSNNGFLFLGNTRK